MNAEAIIYVSTYDGRCAMAQYPLQEGRDAMPGCDASNRAKGACQVLSSPGFALIHKENHYELQVLLSDGEPPEGTANVFLEHAEIDAVVK